MEPRRRDPQPKLDELRQKRAELHGHRRDLHDRLAAICEEFVLLGLSKHYKQSTLVRELGFLHDFYEDEANWQGIE